MLKFNYPEINCLKVFIGVKFGFDSVVEESSWD